MKEFEIYFEDESGGVPFGIQAEDEESAVKKFLEHAPYYFDHDEPRKISVRQVIRFPERTFVIGRDLKVNEV